MTSYIILITAISILFHCYGFTNANLNVKVQQVTENIQKVGPLFFFQRKDELLYTDSKVNGSLMIYNTKSGKTESHYIKELVKETIVTVTTEKMDPEKLIIGSDLNLRVYERKDKGYTITEPIVTFNESGFVINSAHADNKGVLFILLCSKDQKSKLGKLYKVEKKHSELVKELKKGPGDFRFNFEMNKMFMIYDSGNKIKSMDYEMKTSKLSEKHTDVFDKNDHPELKDHSLRSVVLDRDEGYLWVAAAGKIGYILNINPDNKTLMCIHPIASKDLTFVTFGANEYKTLYVGSQSTCVKGIGQGSIFGATGMGKTRGF